MSTPRVYVSLELAPGRSIELPARPAHHLLRVLRLKNSALVTVFNGDGHDYHGHLVEAKGDVARLYVDERTDEEPGAPLEVRLGLGISKGERMDFAIQKAVELGVSRIDPLITEFGQVRLDAERRAKRLAHWQGVAVAACEQSGRRRLPELTATIDVADWLQADHPPSRIVLDPSGGTTLPQLSAPEGALCMLVGAEGGLSPGELEQARERSFISVRLGPRVLRTETAPLAVLAALQVLWGDFRL